MSLNFFVFVLLGFGFGFVFFAADAIEKIFSSKLFTFVLDALMLSAFGTVVYSCIIAYNNGNVRGLFFVLMLTGFVLYYWSVHRLFLSITDKIIHMFQNINANITKKLKNSKKKKKKVLHLK